MQAKNTNTRGGNAIGATRRRKTTDTEDTTEKVVSTSEPTNEPTEEAKQVDTGRTPRRRMRRNETRRREIGSGDVLVPPLWAQKMANQEGYVLHFFNDLNGTGDHIMSMEEEDWELVIVPPGEERSPGRLSAGQARPDGEQYVSKIVDRQTGMKAYLMRKRADWYADDKAEKNKKVDRNEEGLRRQTEVQQSYGGVTVKRE